MFWRCRLAKRVLYACFGGCNIGCGMGLGLFGSLVVALLAKCLAEFCEALMRLLGFVFALGCFAFLVLFRRDGGGGDGVALG